MPRRSRHAICRGRHGGPAVGRLRPARPRGGRAASGGTGALADVPRRGGAPARRRSSAVVRHSAGTPARQSHTRGASGRPTTRHGSQGVASHRIPAHRHEDPPLHPEHRAAPPPRATPHGAPAPRDPAPGDSPPTADLAIVASARSAGALSTGRLFPPVALTWMPAPVAAGPVSYLVLAAIGPARTDSCDRSGSHACAV